VRQMKDLLNRPGSTFQSGIADGRTTSASAAAIDRKRQPTDTERRTLCAVVNNEYGT